MPVHYSEHQRAIELYQQMDLSLMSQEKWDQRWMADAQHVAKWSEDQSRKIGSCIVDNSRNDIISRGWNGLPRGVKNKPERNERPHKYFWFSHAEANSITNAAAAGRSTKDSTIYVNYWPCVECCKLIIQAGIIEVVGFAPNLDDPTFGEGFEIVEQMFREAGVITRFMPGEAPRQSKL